MQFTRNHLWVDSTGAQARLGITDFLRHALEPASFVVLGAGTTVAGGKPFGRVEGEHSACHLYAPFEMSILDADHETGEVRVSILGEPAEQLLSEPEYAAHRDRAPR